MALYIGLMSGTSADGIDAALADFTPGKKIQMLDTSFTAWTEEDRSTISSLCTPGDNELHLAGLFSCRYAETAAGAVMKLLQKNDLTPGDITAVASHGQTVRHEPQNGFSVQIGNHAMLAAITGIDVVCDFRSADIALGGQGAPLVPAFHQEICAHPDIPRYVVNIGGIANVSVLIPGTTVTGFDTGPGNTIIDALARKYLNQYSDFDGKTAASGKPAEEIINRMIAETPYFMEPAPKSTGRELFNLDYLEAFPDLKSLSISDLFATVTELTARTIVDGIGMYRTPGEIYVCGGGSHNPHLMKRISELAHNAGHLLTGTTNDIGVDPDYLEALAFAWLGYKFINKEQIDMREITGTSAKEILGALYPHP